MLTIGVDDAGRGPVIGPMILAGCLMTESDAKELREIGVKDSKQLTQKRREFLEKKIKAKSKNFEVIVVHPKEIDSSLKKNINLNLLEANVIAKIINKLNKKDEKIKVIVDCPSAGRSKWQDYLKTKIKTLSNLEISCEHKADKNYPIVSAASILAKCIREREMNKIKEIYGSEVGSGYTSDPLTVKFLEKYAYKYKDKEIFRKSWITWKRAIDSLSQRKLSL